MYSLRCSLTEGKDGTAHLEILYKIKEKDTKTIFKFTNMKVFSYWKAYIMGLVILVGVLWVW
jgi:hypothetical protein